MGKLVARTISWLRGMYWRYKYRKGRKITFCLGYDWFVEVLIIENRLASSGTVLYRERGVNVFSADQDDFGPIHEESIPDLLERMQITGK